MRVLFVLCALLAIAVTSLARPKDTDNATEKTTTAIPMVIATKNDSSNTSPSSIAKSNDKLTSTTASTTPGETTTDNQKNPTKPDVIPSTKAEVTTNSQNVPTTAITPSEKIITPIKPTVTTGSVTSPTTIETTSIAATTAIPPTSVCPPPTGRHFDGLSFLGGIILTICLIGVGVFLCKYCQNIHEDKYRTL